MSTRLNLSGASVLPFQFPSLRDADEPEPIVAFSDPTVAAPSDGVAPPAASVDAKEQPVDPEEIAAEFHKAQVEGLERGLQEGRERGYAEGAEAGRASVAEAAARLAAIVAHLGDAIPALGQPVEDAIVALTLEIARCVIGSEVKRSHDFLVRLVREAIGKVPFEMGAPRVLLNPVDLELVRKLVPEAESGSATLVGDETIEAGGCLVVADGAAAANKDRRWNPRSAEGVSQVDLTLPSRWRAVMLTLFDGEADAAR
jgi:flagellar assembly protein FliH